MSQNREKFATQVNSEILSAVRTLAAERRPPASGACGRGPRRSHRKAQERHTMMAFHCFAICDALH
ncbi:hypothetical protein BH20ACI3_BH20ACI3_40380 [soil metagenome]